jgi:hypothetical protein
LIQLKSGPHYNADCRLEKIRALVERQYLGLWCAWPADSRNRCFEGQALRSDASGAKRAEARSASLRAAGGTLRQHGLHE